MLHEIRMREKEMKQKESFKYIVKEIKNGLR